MSSIIEGYNYDIFISYRQKDNKGDRWVSEFVDALKTELESTFKEEISVYFDINPHDGLLETHDVDASLKEKLKCLVFIPIISRTYCDPKSFAWEHEFKAFVEEASEDQFGLKVRLPNGNVANRVLPVRIHDLDAADIKECESLLGSVLRGIEFIYKEPGVNRPITIKDNEEKNLNKTNYRNQINKVALAVRDIITAIEHPGQKTEGILKEVVKAKPEKAKELIPKTIVASVIILVLIVLGYFLIPTLTNPKEQIEKSIAVLPFINDSPNDSNQYFINGFMEDVLNHLQTIKDLHPISRTSAEKYRKTTKSIPEIAKELSVNYIVEGDMQRYGNSIRLSVNLFKALKKELKLWGKTYEKKINDATDIFSLQSQIAQSIATELEAVITPQEKLLIEKTQTSSLSAYENCILGINYCGKLTKEDFDIALNYFEKAIEIDPDYADAYLGIAQVWMWRVFNSLSTTPEEATPMIKSNLTKAFKSDSTSAEVYSVLAEIQMFFDGDFKSAEGSIEKAISVNPNNEDAHISYGNLLEVLGHPKEALVEYELALKLDPMNKVIKTYWGTALIYARRYNEAIKVFQEVLKTDPGNVGALDGLPVAFHAVGRYSEELEAWKVDYTTCFKGYANVFDQGYTKGGLTGALNLQADSLVKKSKTKFILPGEIALLYACAGNKERTLDMLEWDYEVHDPTLPFGLRYPIFEFVHDEPRYQNLFHKINLPYKP
jgi:TolB-like protein